MPKDKTIHHRRPGFFVYPNPAKMTAQIHREHGTEQPLKKKKQLVNLGGEGDCGFRALAAGMVDNIFENDRRAHATANQELHEANKKRCIELMDRFVALFPHYKEDVPEGTWTFVQVLGRMRYKQGFIPDLAYTLRQAAVDEIVAHPEDYPGVDYAEMEHPEFTQDDQQTSPILMRQLDTWIDESAIAAVAQVFNVPVTVRVTKANEEIFKPMHYGPDPQTSSVLEANRVEIRLEDNHYQPMLADSDAFAAVISQSAFTQQPDIAEVEFNDPSLKVILEKIKAADEKLVADFNEHHARLTELVSEGKLNKDLLLKIYIQGLNKPNNSGYLAGRVRHVGLEYGNQDFFARAVKNAKSGMPLTRSNPNDEFDKIICDEAVHAIARAMVTTFDLSPDEVYAQIDGDEQTIAPR